MLNKSRNKAVFLFLLGIGLSMIGGGVAIAIYNQTIGLRNNNAGNLRITDDKWLGLSPIQKGAFFSFIAPEYGIRALYKTLLTYRKAGKSTVNSIIATWAPKSDNNDTESYIKHVSDLIGVPRNAQIPLAKYPNLVKAIIRHENGIQPYPDSLIQKGIALS